MGLASASLYWHTLRHLKPRQLVARIRHELKAGLPDVGQRASPIRRPTVAPFAKPIARPEMMLGPAHFRFLNEEGWIAGPQDWNQSKKAKLWLYNLHYFDDLMAAGAAQRTTWHRALIARWIAENPPGYGNGWEPYPLSLRIVNWIKWVAAGNRLDETALASLYLQVQLLARRIEWHLLGNHLLANAKALVFAGLFFSGSEADLWLAQGLAIYERELSEQVLADGAHFELSPMYHAIILEDLLDLMNAAQSYCQSDRHILRDLPEMTTHMRTWLAAMTHPDGGVSFFNDAAFGIAATLSDLEAYANRLGLQAINAPDEGAHHLKKSGYVRVNRGDMAAILDLAAVGPDYIPGHAHADTLSFELSLGAERIVVNGGTSTYASGVLREAQRATRTHSTVEIAGQDSSEVWASFRVARRARVMDVQVDEQGDRISVTGAHDGYCRLAGRPLHRRSWTFNRGSLLVEDRIESARRLPTVARIHLGPDVIAVKPSSATELRLETRAGRTIKIETTSESRIEPGNWHPEFGKAIPIHVVSTPIDNGTLTTRLCWA